MQFADEKGKRMYEYEVTDIFNYEDKLKQTVLEKNIGHKVLEKIQNDTYKKIYVVPAAN